MSDTGVDSVEPEPRCSWQVPMSGMKVRSLVVLSNHFAFHRWSAQSAILLLLSSSDELMSCCMAGTNGCRDLRCRAFWMAPWQGVLETVWLLCDRAPSAGWMPARIGRLSTGVGRRHPVTCCRASLMTESVRRVWALRHQAGVQYSAVEWTRAKVAVRSVVVPAPQPEPASRLKSVTRDVRFLRSDGDTWVSCPTLLRGIWARSKRAGFRRWSWLETHV